LVDGEQVTVEWSSGKQKATVGVESGTRNVEVKKEGFTAVAETLTFKDGKETVFTATLERNRPEPPKADAESSAPAPAKSVTKNEPETGNMPPADTPAPAKAPAPSQIASKVDSRAAAAATFTNSLGMEFALIPAGKFRMGSPASEKDRSSDEAQVDVTLTKSFYLGKTEVTQGQWRAVMGTTPWKGKSFVKEGDNYPATYLSWEDAQAFCKKLSEKENGKYRLPTEAEWEYACRGGSTTRFSFGDNEAQLGGFAWYDRNADAIGEEYAHEVGKKQANSFGLHDMHGNVWEWCEDVYAAKLQGGMDPLVSSGGSHRVVRGGSWLSEASRCRSALRGRFAPDYRRDYLGFRVARVPGSQ
jgi:formylglycine-generating enzyme required for sulfatase activity